MAPESNDWEGVRAIGSYGVDLATSGGVVSNGGAEGLGRGGGRRLKSWLEFWDRSGEPFLSA